jgi:hypothetical protein
MLHVLFPIGRLQKPLGLRNRCKDERTESTIHSLQVVLTACLAAGTGWGLFAAVVFHPQQQRDLAAASEDISHGKFG